MHHEENMTEECHHPNLVISIRQIEKCWNFHENPKKWNCQKNCPANFLQEIHRILLQGELHMVSMKFTAVDRRIKNEPIHAVSVIGSKWENCVSKISFETQIVFSFFFSNFPFFQKPQGGNAPPPYSRHPCHYAGYVETSRKSQCCFSVKLAGGQLGTYIGFIQYTQTILDMDMPTLVFIGLKI